MSFGQYDPTKRSTNNNFSKRFYLKDGSNLYRVLPPTKSLKDRNKIAQYWSVIWLTDTRGKKRPVASILKKNKDEILQHDPLLNKIEELRRDYELATKNNDTASANLLRETMKRVYNKKVYALNVLSAAGELGVLEIPYTSYQNLERRIHELYNQGIDAIGIGEDKGVYFDFKKTKDERGRVVYPVDVATKTTKDSSGNFIITYIRAPLTEEEATMLSERAEDLTKLYSELSVEEMTALATLDQRVFDAIFSRSQSNTALDETDEETDNSEEVSVGKTLSANASLTTITPSALAVGFTQNTVLNNEKIKNFLFPDKK